MSEIVSYLEELNLLDLNYLSEYIYESSLTELDNLVLYLRELIDKEYFIQDYTPFTFVPNSDISGTGGCDEISCKLGRANNFAIFSALYADKVYIQLKYITSEHFDFASDYSREVSDFQFRHRENIEKDIALLIAYSDLIQSKIVMITPTHKVMCESCFKKEILNKNMVINIELLQKEYCKKAKLFLLDYDSEFESYDIGIRNADEIFSDHNLFWTVRDRKDLQVLSKETVGKYIKNKEYSNEFITSIILDEIIDACYTAKYCGEQYGKLITNKKSDAMFLGMNNSMTKLNQIENHINILPEYDLPFVKGLTIKDVIHLREEEQESFNKYRIALNKAIIEQNKTDKPNDWVKIYDDYIYPEFNNLNLKIKQLKQGRMSRIFGSMVVIGAAIVANKFGDIIKPDLFSSAQTIGTTVASAGINFVLDKASTKKANLQDNDYYFLWKLKQKHTKDR
jgi:hypothetical protein